MGPAGGECSTPADLIFAIDESSSISAEDFFRAKEFVKNTIAGLDNVAEDGVR